jgi:hypothetical protein
MTDHEPRSSPALGTAVARTRDLSVPVPDGWSEIVVDGADLVLAMPERSDGPFRPNVVVTREPTTEPATAAAADAIAAVLALRPGTQILSVDLDPSLPADAQTVTYGYQADQTYVLVQQWVVVVGGARVNITASCAVEEMMWVHGHFAALVHSMRFDGVPA